MIPFGFVWDLTTRDFTEKFAGSILGSLWNFVWPLVQLFIYIVIFGKFMGGRLPGNSEVYSYGIYVAAGLIPWTSFTNTIARSSRVFLDKKHIISKVRVSLPSLPLFICLSEGITYCITMFFLFAVVLLTGPDLSAHFVVMLVFLYYLQQILAWGLGTFCAIFTVFVRDFNEIVNIVLQLAFWFTPIVYVPTILPHVAKKLLVLNPAYPLIESYHQIFVFHGSLPIESLLVLCVIAHAVFLGSYLTLHFLEKDIRDFL